jgi:hypothetical protein
MSQESRRKFLKIGGSALAMIPVLAMTNNAFAAKSAARAGLQYQDTAKDGKSCSTCMQFVPGKTAKDLGGCKVLPGDTEISPNAYCAAYAKKA